ncbi:MAG: hypothetical protein JJU16_02945 [Alkalibacterium sp.]|nr:hypothetical protein [Alkalibacterium sp.]
MEKGMTMFTLGIILILISTPIGYWLVGVLYQNQNLTGEYTPILNGYIHSLMLAGSLLSITGLVVFMRDKK